MKILLTGNNGFLGKMLFEYLSQKNIIYTLSRHNANILCDLSNTVPFLNNKYDLVIHCAGLAHFTPKTENENESFFYINVNGTKNLLKSLENLKPNQFVFISSVSVYGLIKGENINELTPLLAKDPYGKSKIEAEEIVKKWCNDNKVICTILRLPLIVGENPPGNLGAMIQGIKNGYYFNISGGNSRKSMVLGTDVAHFILKAAEIGGTYNLTDGFHPSFQELSNEIARRMSKNFVPNLANFLAILIASFGDLFGNKFPLTTSKYLKITSTLTFDDSRARSAFGWNPSPVIESFIFNKYVQ